MKCVSKRPRFRTANIKLGIINENSTPPPKKNNASVAEWFKAT